MVSSGCAGGLDVSRVTMHSAIQQCFQAVTTGGLPSMADSETFSKMLHIEYGPALSTPA
jgi:hypothetical protein